MKSNAHLYRMAQGAMMIALATVLSLLKLFEAPMGGSVTVGSMVPILLFAIMYEFRWSMLTALAYSLLQLLMGAGYLAGLNLWAVFGGAAMDYVLAFTVLAVAGVVARRFRNKVVGAGVGTIAAMVLRLGCHFVSGLLIWGSYAPEGMPVWIYSITYNGWFMLFETLISTTLVCLLVAFLPLDRIRKA